MITPAGYTFSIWGLIYVLLLAFVIYLAMPSNRDKSFLGRISFLFALSTIFNIVWLVLWHYEFLAPSVILMFGLLATLIAIYLRLDIGKGHVSVTERIAVHVPFTVYLMWITIASIANVAVVLTAVDWDTGGIDLVSWAALMIAVALLIALVVIAKRKDVAYGLVIVWALGGIMMNQMETQEIFLLAGVDIAIVLVAFGVMAIVSRLKQ